MRLISVCGISKSGKTTTAEIIISGLKRRGYSVGSIKDIHFEDFKMDTEGSNTFRHHAAGAEPVCAMALGETDILYHERLPLAAVLAHFNNDFVILEGTYDPGLPKILTGHAAEDILERMDDCVVALSGRAAVLYPDGLDGRPSINPLTEPDRLIDFTIQKAFEPLPGFSAHSCGRCGADCAEMTLRIISGRASREDCKNSAGLALKIGGKDIEMVPFVKAALRKIVTGFASELRGYKEHERIEITIEPK